MAMHPGWVLTEMGGPNAQITTETCVTGMHQHIHTYIEGHLSIGPGYIEF